MTTITGPFPLYQIRAAIAEHIEQGAHLEALSVEITPRGRADLLADLLRFNSPTIGEVEQVFGVRLVDVPEGPHTPDCRVALWGPRT